jgi:tRNA dimethylallyltransferase
MMIEAGLVEEVSRLINLGIDANTTAMQGLGYKEIAGYLGGEYGLDEAVELLKKNTRRFAKRQYTWFRADPRIQWIDVGVQTASEVSLSIKESLDK